MSDYIEDHYNGPVNPGDLIALREALEEEQERRSKSDDVLDHGTLLPFADWESHPGQSQNIEMPASPRDRYLYVGSTNQMFYDVFPEGHRDEAVINKYLRNLNKDWMELTPKYLTYQAEQLDRSL
jgi:hypothetical protein